MKLAALLLGAVVLTGCASRQEVAAEDDALCRSYGATLGSKEYLECRMTQDARRDQRGAARRKAIADWQPPTIQAPQIAPLSPPALLGNNQTRCTSRNAGFGQVETVCN